MLTCSSSASARHENETGFKSYCYIREEREKSQGKSREGGTA